MGHSVVGGSPRFLAKGVSPLTSAEDAALEDRSASDGSADADPRAPGIRGCGADAKRQRSDHGPAGQVNRSAVDTLGLLLVKPVGNAAAHHPEPHVERVTLDGQYFLDVPQITGAHRPVATHPHFAELESREAAGSAQGE